MVGQSLGVGATWPRREGARCCWGAAGGSARPDVLLLPAGTPLPPRGVRLWAQNFHVQLRWEPDPRAQNGTAYQVEWRKR